MANKRRKGSFLPAIKKHVLRVFKSEWSSGITDGRSTKNQIWSFGYALEVLFVGILSGAKTLREVETKSELYDERLPDTTLENLLAKADASELPELLAQQVKQACRDHELDKGGLSFHLTVIDGKANYATKEPVSEKSKERTHYGQHKTYQHMNLRAMIVSSQTKLYLGEHEIGNKKAETSELIPFIDKLRKHYGRTELLNVVSVDAGMAHRSNMKALRERGIHFIMGLKENQPTIFAKAKLLLHDRPREKANTSSSERYNGKDVSYFLYRESVRGYFSSAPHIHQIWRIEKESVNPSTGEVVLENRYYMSSLPTSDITPKQCLKATRSHWGIENNGNWTLDALFGEDDCPMTTRAMTLVSHVRMLAYNCIVRFKYRTLRKNENREMSWKRLFEFFQVALRNIRIELKAKKEQNPTFV